MQSDPSSTAETDGAVAEQSETSVNSAKDENRTVDTNVVESIEPVVNIELKDETTELDVKANSDDSDTKCETDVTSTELDSSNITGKLDTKLVDTCNSADESDMQELLTDTTSNVTSAEPDVPAKDNIDTDEPTDSDKLCNGPKEELTEPPLETATDEEAMLVDDKNVPVEQIDTDTPMDTGDDSLNKSPPSQDCDMSVDDGGEPEDQPMASTDCTLSEMDDHSLDHDMEQEKPVFVHVSTKSDTEVEGDGDGDCDKTSLNTHADLQGEAAEEDPIGISHDGVKDDDTLMDFTEEGVDKESVPIKVVDFNDETITSDKSAIEEELVASKGADEELCIIPDTEREISQEEKDAATAAAAAAAAAETPRTVTEHTDADSVDTVANDNQSKTNKISTESSAEKTAQTESKSDESNLTKGSDETDQSVANAGINDEQPDTIPTKDAEKQIQVTDLPETEAPEKSCPQCSEIRKCKYKVDYMDEITHVCSEACVLSFRKDHNCVPYTSPETTDLNTPEAANKTPPTVPEAIKIFVRKCGECTLQIPLGDNKILSWETMDFCGEDCLSKYQNRIGSHCANCKKSVQMSSLGKYCVRFGHDIRQFCCSLCLEEFKKGLKVCSYCQKDISAGSEGFLAPVGDKGQFKDFCSQLCMEKYDQMSNKNAKKSAALVDVTQCSVCIKEKQVHVLYDQFDKKHKFCSEPCFVAFKFVNVSNPVQCDMCKKYFENENTTEFSIFYDNAVRNFCCKTCQNIYIIANRRIVPCSWCKVKKYNFDMIKKMCPTGQILMMCSLNCLSLFQVSINAVCSKKMKCDNCSKMTTAMYHLTMSDATIRNFCTYPCVMAFQNQFAKVPITLTTSSGSSSGSSSGVSSVSSSPSDDKPTNKTAVVPASGPKRYQTRVSRSLVTDSGNEVQMPVITNVQSLANTTNGLPPLTQPQPATSPPKQQVKQQVIVRAPPYPAMRNAGTWCKPILHTKGVSCRPHPANKETQTEQIKEKTVFIPVPVPIYVPSPMPMFSAPIPVPIPFPLPIPIPIFIPTTRNSAAGIMKEIKKIQVKIPTDPFEAELLMMAEMVAGEKKVDNTDSESDEDDNAGSAADGGFSPEAVDTSNTFGDDMLQMALKMATELDEPAVDLEGALTANTITASQSQDATVVSTEESVDDPQPMHQLIDRQALRGRKRANRPARNINPSKRGRRMSSHVEMPLLPPPQPQQPPEPIEKPDANMCLKYTFGVNAWKQWVTTKNAELEKSSRRVKLFKNEILQLTADELNYSLCLFVKEVRKPNGTEYAPDTIYYLCLGIQQYLFENGRIDNIFTDAYYEKFTDCLDEVARKFSVLYNDSHYIVTRVEEEHLWESKQLGAHSPHVLLSTLMFFNTKHFNLTTVDEHMQLSFSHIMKHWKRNANQPPGSAKMPGSRNVLLRFYPPQTTLDANSRKKKVYEQQENEDNPLRCPVKLYEFYLSKCPESVKTRNDVFYLLPERSCVPDSPVWYSTMALGREALEKMLHRVKMVKEINVALLTS
ncbi:without children [Carabus blaptoides fortunei]